MTSTASPDSPVRLVVVFGGQSAEHEVSCTTAAHVLAAVDPERYELEAIGITREGRFVQADEALKTLAGGARELPSPLEASGPSTDLVSVVSAPPATGSDARTVVLPLLHGPLGEDGTIQGLLELAGVAYVGAGVLGSAVAMDKAMTKTILEGHGIPQAEWASLGQHELARNPDAIIEDLVDYLELPLFVKPANMGSSVGVSKAHTMDEVHAALDKAFRYDELVVMEEAVTAREIELSVLGNNNPDVSVPGEIVPGAEFYDYEDKYVTGQAKLIIPADLPQEIKNVMKALAGDAYRLLRVEGMARVDFLYEEGGRGPLVNELNTIPGFTPISMYPKLWEASGLPYPKLIDRLVELAIERHDRRMSKRTTDWH